MQEINHKALQMEKVLDALSPNALRMLERSLSISLCAGTAGPNADLMLQTIRKLSGYTVSPEKKVSLKGPLKRAILAPLQPFLISQAQKNNQTAMVNGQQMETIWSFIEEVLIPSEFRHAVEALENLSAEKDVPFTHSLMRKAVARAAAGLHQIVVSAGRKQLDDALQQESDHKRLRRRLGGFAAFEAFQEVLYILEKSS